MGQPTADRRTSKRTARRSLFVAGMVLLGSVAALAVFFTVYRNPSGSMLPTIRPGERLVASRLHYTLFKNKPRVGDVIVFEHPQDREKVFLKRVVAVGGDTIAMIRNEVVLNGRPLERRRVAEPCTYPDVDEEGRGEPRSCTAFEERFERRRWRVIQDPVSMVRDTAPVSVPAGHVFVLGDNRDNSHDSRFWGTVPADHITGRVLHH
jgi:signal peptidase I